MDNSLLDLTAITFYLNRVDMYYRHETVFRALTIWVCTDDVPVPDLTMITVFTLTSVRVSGI